MEIFNVQLPRFSSQIIAAITICKYGKKLIKFSFNFVYNI